MKFAMNGPCGFKKSCFRRLRARARDASEAVMA